MNGKKVNKLQFGMAAFGTNIMSNVVGALLLVIYCASGAELVDKLLATTLLGFASLWDALIDPLIGHFSDNLRTKQGRRRPLMLVGAPIEAIALICLLIPPKTLPSTTILIWLIVFRIIFFTFHSLVCVAYDSLIGEMARTASDRVELSTIKSVMAQIGVLVGTLVGGMLFTSNPLFFAILVAAVGLVCVYITIPTVPTMLPEKRESTGNPFKELAKALKIKPFLVILFTALTYIATQTVMMQNLYFMLTANIGLSHEAATSNSLYILAGIVLLMIASVFVWKAISKKAGITKMYRVCFLGLTATCVIAFGVGKYTFLPGIVQVIVCLALVAVCLAGALMFAFAIMGNVVDLDEAINGERREATFYGVFAIASGVGSALGTQIIGICHEFGDTFENSFGVSAVFLVLAALALVGYILLRNMKLGDTVEESKKLNFKEKITK